MPNMDEEEPPDECLKKMKSKGQQATPVHNLLLGNKSTIDVLMNCEDFGTLKRLLRVTAHVIKFVGILKARSTKLVTTPDENLSGSDLMKAEFYWIKAVQCALQCNERQQEPDAVRGEHLPEGRPKRIASAIARERITMLADQISD